MSTPSTDAVFHRRNKQIQDAIESHSLKQALQLVEKRIKKGENTRFLKAWKAHILSLHSDETHRQKGIAETLDICKLEPATADLDTLEILHSTLVRIPGQDGTVRALWEKAAKIRPQELEIQSKWFSMAFEAGDWKTAQKAAMTLQINFPKTRKYYFWAIFLSYLMAIEPSASDADRKLFGTLAYRMVSKAAESVPADPKELLSPPRAIQSGEELYLLIKIFESQGRRDEIVKVLDSENVGLNSRIVQNDWFFIRAKLLSLEKTENWTNALGYARELLKLPDDETAARALLKERDDWGVWELLLTATKELNDQGTTQDTQKFLEEFVQRFPRSRNTQLALLDFTVWRMETGPVTSADLLAACQTYYDRNSTKLYCFGDLQRYVTSLGEEETSKLVDYVLEKTDVSSKGSSTFDEPQQVSKINAFKLEYCLRLFPTGKASTKQTESFISRCLKAYRDAECLKADSSSIENQPRDVFCLLAAMSLIRCSDHWERVQQTKAPSFVLIRAAAILDRLLKDSSHNYEALLLLVRLYLLVGAGSLAFKTFSKLSVKHIQNETVGHNLFTRIDTIHPHRAPPPETEDEDNIPDTDYRNFSPDVALDQALSFYRHANTTANRQRNSGLQLGSYINVEGTIELQKRLNASICRKMWAAESNRIERLIGDDVVEGHADLVSDTSKICDERTFDGFMNCEVPDQPTFEELVRVGPLPRESWVKSTRVIDRTFIILQKILSQRSIGIPTELPSIDELTLSEVDLEDMTTAERHNAKIHTTLLKIASLLSDSKSVPGETIDGLAGRLEAWLKSTLESVSESSNVLEDTTIALPGTNNVNKVSAVPSWQYLHNAFLLLDTLKAISLEIMICTSKNVPKTGSKLPKDVADTLKKLVHAIHEAIKSNTRALKSRITESGMLETLIDLILKGGESSKDDGSGGGSGSGDSELHGELQKTLEAGALEIFCGKLMESWEEGLGGIFQVSLQ